VLFKPEHLKSVLVALTLKSKEIQFFKLSEVHLASEIKFKKFECINNRPFG